MNKYQEVLDFIVKSSCPTHNCCSDCNIETICNCEAKAYIDILQELIDKATPEKPIPLEEKEYGYEHECPTCGRYVGTIVEDYVEHDDYCCSCGQRLDWSDEYE